jgi:hypothetical protein
MKCIYLLLAFSISAHAIEIERRDQKLFLRDQRCDKVSEITRTLAAWTKKDFGLNECPIERISPAQSADSCEFEITNCLPPHVVKYQGVNPEVAGPNCWNLALVFREILPGLRNSPAEEIAFFMGPPLCRILKDDEDRKAGDIGLIRRPTKNTIAGNYSGKHEEHAFIYISEKIVYSKNGSEKTAPFSLQSLASILDFYGVPKENVCRSNEWNPDSDCQKTTAYFRCQSMADYLRSDKAVSPSITQALEKFDRFEKCLGDQVFAGATPISAIATSGVLQSVQALAKVLGAEKKKMEGRTDEASAFVLGSLQMRLLAIGRHLRADAEPNEARALYELTEPMIDRKTGLPKR